MMGDRNLSRRSFISTASGAVGSGYLATHWPFLLAAAAAGCERRSSGAGYVSLDDALAGALEAVAEQIIPEDDAPGARQIGVVWFIDQLLAGSWGGLGEMLKAGVQQLDDLSGTPEGFASLDFKRQTAILEDLESAPFFSTMRFLTLCGVFAMPGRGGNREKLGWALIGFEDRHAWQPPFGYYDAEWFEGAGGDHET